MGWSLLLFLCFSFCNSTLIHIAYSDTHINFQFLFFLHTCRYSFGKLVFLFFFSLLVFFAFCNFAKNSHFDFFLLRYCNVESLHVHAKLIH